MFGYDPAENGDTGAEPTPMPVGDDAPTLTPSPTEDGPAPLAFTGFASPLPLLLERPSLYMKRLRDAAESMFMTPDGGDVTDRILYSPAVALPFFVMHGDELYAGEHVMGYPLLHAPDNHQPGEGDDPSVYALTMIAAYTAMGLIREDGDGNLLAYGIPVGEPFGVDDETWAAADDWARTMVYPLGELNKARLLGFALRDPDNERDALAVLFDAWGETRDPNTLIQAGKEAARQVDVDYGIFIDTSFKPFNER